MNDYLKYGQMKSLRTMKPYPLKVHGKWIMIRGLKDIERALKLRDKKVKRRINEYPNIRRGKRITN